MAKTSTHTITKTNGAKRKREEPQTVQSRKRRNSDEPTNQEIHSSDISTAATTLKPTESPDKVKTKRTSKKPSNPREPTQTTTTTTDLSSSSSSIDPQISTLPPLQLSQKFTQTIQTHNPSLSTIELEDLSLPTHCFLDTTTFHLPRDPSHLPTFLETFTPGGTTTLTATPSAPSTPHTLLLTTSAIRTTHLLRPLRPLGTADSKIAKLFAKHMKLSAMEEYVRKTTFGIAAGTPGRILDLARSGVLKTQGLKRVVIDGSYVDGKGRGLWGDKEGWERVVDLLNLESVKAGLVGGHTQVLVF